MNVVIAIVASVLGIFVVILIHELGHFFVARWCGVRVEKFSIGFGKALWSWRDKKGTEYVLAMIPLGGYIKMFGEGDEVTTTAESVYAYNRKPLLTRMAIVFAGPCMNFFLGVVLFAVVYMIGVIHIKPVIGKVVPNSIAAQSGLKHRDEIVEINGTRTVNWQQVMMAIVQRIGDRGKMTMTVRPAGSQKTEIRRLPLNNWMIDKRNPQLFESLGFEPFIPNIPPVIARVLPGSPAEQAGLRRGDRIIALDDHKIDSWLRMLELVQKAPDKQITLLIKRGDQQLRILIKTGNRRIQGKVMGYIGVASVSPKWPPGMRAELKYSPITAWWPALKQAWGMIVFNFIVLIKMIIGKISIAMLGGPITIFKVAGQASLGGLSIYLGFIGFISVTLAFINVLPIPGLDGGHLLFHIIEGIFRRPIPEKIQLILLRVGILILILIMVQATLNDLLRLFHKV